MSFRLGIFLMIFWLTAAGQTPGPARAPRVGQLPATTSPQTAAPAVVPRPSPVPAPTPVSPALSSAPILTGPKYSPFQMDFGTIDYNASSRRTFLLTAPSLGEITLQIPRGAFAAVELRRVPPVSQGNRGALARVGGSTPVTPVPSSPASLFVLYKWNFATGEEMQIDLLFTPNAIKDASPGLRTASMELVGPGNQPWHVSIPLRGVVAGPLVQLNPQAVPSAQAKKPAATKPSSTATGTVSALPTPASASSIAPGTVSALPTPASGGVQGAAPVLNAPVYSPNQFDFGEVWDGDLTRKTLYLTTNASGYVTVQLPSGPYRVVEFREMGPVQSPQSKNPGSKSPNLGPIQPVKTKITYQDGQSGPFQWSLGPGVDIQIVIGFQPHFNLMSEIAGQKSATMKVTGPGPHGNWLLSIPIVGMFDGLKLSATMAPENKEILAIAGEKYVPLNLTLFGLDTPVSGTVRAGSQVPPGVSVISKAVKVGAKEKLPVTVWLSLGNISADRNPRPLELLFDDGKKTSKALFQFIGLPGSRTFTSGERNDCVVSHLRLTLTLEAPMHNKITGGFYIASLDDATGDPGTGTYDVQMSMSKGLSLDGYMVGSFMLFAETGGVRVLDQNYWPTYETQNGTEIKKTGPVSAGHGPRQWMQILDGQARFGCQLSRYMNHDPNKIPEVLCGPNYECTKIKWAPMQ